MQSQRSGWFQKGLSYDRSAFIIRTILQQAKHSKRELYFCFVDFKKAFNLVPRESLWQVLERRGMSGRVLFALQSMYKQDKACVLTSEGPTEMFECNIGVKQGCPASPLLFSLLSPES